MVKSSLHFHSSFCQCSMTLYLLCFFLPCLLQPFPKIFIFLSISDSHSNLLYGPVLPTMPCAVSVVLSIKAKEKIKPKELQRNQPKNLARDFSLHGLLSPQYIQCQAGLKINLFSLFISCILQPPPLTSPDSPPLISLFHFQIMYKNPIKQQSN